MTDLDTKQKEIARINPKRIDPLTYARICPECSLRSGTPSHGLWIDIVACPPCVAIRKRKTKAARERGH